MEVLHLDELKFGNEDYRASRLFSIPDFCRSIVHWSWSFIKICCAMFSLEIRVFDILKHKFLLRSAKIWWNCKKKKKKKSSTKRPFLFRFFVHRIWSVKICQRFVLAVFVYPNNTGDINLWKCFCWNIYTYTC